MIIYTPKLNRLKSEEKNLDFFEIEPLPKGMGHTLGNAIRRTLYGFVTGVSLSNIKSTVVPHKFSTLDFCLEDAYELISNFKQVIFCPKSFKEEEKKLIVFKTKTLGDVKASELNDEQEGIKVINGDHHLMHKGFDDQITMEIELIKGKANSCSNLDEKIDGKIYVDPIFSPVLRSNYKTERSKYSKEGMEFDKLILEVLTNGSVTPKEALLESIKSVNFNLDNISELLNNEA